MADNHYEHPRLAAVYDPLESDRSDLAVYLAIAEELRATSVLDVGCGTGTFATMLAAAGLAVTGVDPAASSLDVARTKPGADRVRWIHGDAAALPPMQVDLATMTGNVAQAIADPEDWTATLHGIRGALRPGGFLVFETRDPAARGWEQWNRAATYLSTDIPGVGAVQTWVDVLEVRDAMVTFRSTYVFAVDGAVMTSDSTLRFRERAEVAASLAACGYAVTQVRQAPDRPEREFVFFARRRG